MASTNEDTDLQNKPITIRFEWARASDSQVPEPELSNCTCILITLIILGILAFYLFAKRTTSVKYSTSYCWLHKRQQLYKFFKMGQKSALVVITDGTEEMEAVTPIDVLRRAGVDVFVAGLVSSNPVVCSRNVVIVPDGSLNELSSIDYDAIILPGGLKGAEAFANSPVIGDLLKEQEERGKLICALCAAPIALKAHGIGSGKKLTSYPSVKGKVDEPSMNYTYEEDRVVIDGGLITSRGPGTALEFSLVIAAALVGQEKAEEVGKSMLFHGFST